MRGLVAGAAGLIGRKLCARRGLTLPEVSATVGEEIAAPGRAAGDGAARSIRRRPDRTMARGAGRSIGFDAGLAAALGLTAKARFDAIVGVDQEDDDVAIVA